MEKSIHAPKNWQPEHCPIGSQLVYKSGFASCSTFHTVEVTGHVYNGVDSWVFESNSPSPIFPDDPEKFASANGDHIVAILKRGDGGFKFNQQQAEQRELYREGYIERIERSNLTRYKGKHEYVAHDMHGLVMHAIHFNDELFSLMSDHQHRYRFEESFYAGLADLINHIGPYGMVLTANKRKLVKRIKRLLPKARVTKKVLLKEEADWYREDYERCMELEYGDMS